MNSKQLKYGHTRGGSVSVPVALAASQTFVAASGKFVYLAAGLATIADDGANEIFGHATIEAGVTSSTAGKQIVSVIVDPSAIFRVPVAAGTYVVAMKGKTCDILIDANGIQGADLSASADDVLIVVDGDEVDNLWVDVMINQKERAQSGVV